MRAADVLTRSRVASATMPASRKLYGTIRFRQAEGASVSAQTPQVVQVDGDAIGTARIVHARVDRGALDIAVPPVD